MNKEMLHKHQLLKLPSLIFFLFLAITEAKKEWYWSKMSYWSLSSVTITRKNYVDEIIALFMTKSSWSKWYEKFIIEVNLYHFLIVFFDNPRVMLWSTTHATSHNLIWSSFSVDVLKCLLNPLYKVLISKYAFTIG